MGSESIAHEAESKAEWALLSEAKRATGIIIFVNTN